MSSSSYPDHIRIQIERNGQKVPLLLPILQAQFDTRAVPVSVILGSPRTTTEVWMLDICLYEDGEVVDLTPEEDQYAVEYAFEFLRDAPVAENEEAA